MTNNDLADPNDSQKNNGPTDSNDPRSCDFTEEELLAMREKNQQEAKKNSPN